MRARVLYRDGVPFDLIFLEVNGAFARISPAELVGRRASDAVPGLIGSPTFAAYCRVLESGQPERLETRGSILTSRWFQVSVDRAGPDEVIALVEDITERKTAELRLTTQFAVSRALAAAEDIVEDMPSVLEAMCRGKGWDAAAIWLEDGDALDFIAEWGMPTIDLAPLSALSRGLKMTKGMDLPGLIWETGKPIRVDDLSTVPETPHITLSRAAGMVAVRAFPIANGRTVLGAVVAMSGRAMAPDNNDELVISLGQQIGQFVARVRAQADLRRLNAELEARVAQRTADLAASNAELEAFSYSVSHDLRAPLRAINGYAQILLEDHGEAMTPDARRLVDIIGGRGARMGALIDDLLAFSRLGRQEVRRHGVDVEALAHTVVLEQPPGKATLTVGALPRANGDVALLRQVWTNLIGNALKYSRDREAPVVEIGFADGAYYVRDNGVGFEMKYADKLFGVFQRLHRDDEFEGTGVGLAIVRRIIERHGGEVWVKATLGEGATFYFTLEPDV